MYLKNLNFLIYKSSKTIILIKIVFFLNLQWCTEPKDIPVATQQNPDPPVPRCHSSLIPNLLTDSLVKNCCSCQQKVICCASLPGCPNDYKCTCPWEGQLLYMKLLSIMWNPIAAEFTQLNLSCVQIIFVLKICFL